MISTVSCVGAAFIRPPPILSGDVIRIVAPAGAVNPSSLSAGESFLGTSYNLTIQQDAHVLDVDFYYAGTDAVRAQEVLDAFTETEVKAIWAARGEMSQPVIEVLCLSPRARWVRDSKDSLYCGDDLTAWTAQITKVARRLLGPHCITRRVEQGRIAEHARPNGFGYPVLHPGK
jgi:muramoyltetrapeptide carboxypeptidase LdcA involved in peptidoglycan recycling